MFALLAATLVTGAAPKVVSPPWAVLNIKPELAAFYAEQLAQGLRNEGLTVTTAGDIATLLGAERQRQLLGCSEGNACLVELANALGCDATLTVNLAKLGETYRGLARVLSSRDGSVLSSVTLEAEDESALVRDIERAAKVLALPLVPRSPTKALALWWVPGAVGVVGAGTSAVLFGLAANRHQVLLSTPSSIEGAAAAQDGTRLQGAGWVAGSVGLAAIVGSVVWLLLGSADVTPAVSLLPEGAALVVGGSF